VTVPSCTPELVSFLQATFGGSVSNKKPDKKNHTPSQAWRVTGDKALELLSKILPYLKEPEKIRRGKLLVDEYKKLTPRNGKYTDERRAKKLGFEHRFFEEASKPSRQADRMRWATA
jgi:hypothetical protein